MAPRRVEVERGEGADPASRSAIAFCAEIEHGAAEAAGLDPAGKIERGEHQRRPSSEAMIRSVSRRAARDEERVRAAIGQRRNRAFPLAQETRIEPEITGEVAMSVTMNTITLISTANSSLAFGIHILCFLRRAIANSE